CRLRCSDLHFFIWTAVFAKKATTSSCWPIKHSRSRRTRRRSILWRRSKRSRLGGNFHTAKAHLRPLFSDSTITALRQRALFRRRAQRLNRRYPTESALPPRQNMTPGSRRRLISRRSAPRQSIPMRSNPSSLKRRRKEFQWAISRLKSLGSAANGAAQQQMSRIVSAEYAVRSFSLRAES